MTKVQDVFPKRLQSLMDSTKTTQQKLSDFIGVKRQSIAQYADGSILPTIEKLDKIADYFGVSADYLLGRTDMPSPSLDYIAVHALTGLSNEAIIALSNGRRFANEVRQAANDFITSEHFFTVSSLINDLKQMIQHEEEIASQADHPKVQEALSSAIESLDAVNFQFAIISLGELCIYQRYKISKAIEGLIDSIVPYSQFMKVVEENQGHLQEIKKRLRENDFI